MPKKRLFWQIYPSYLAIIFISLIAIALYVSHSIQQIYLDILREDLKSTARIFERELWSQEPPFNPEQVDRLCREFGEIFASRITVILPDGLVIGDSDGDPAVMENHKDRPEIHEAFQGQTGESLRYSATLHKKMMYITLPMIESGDVIAVVRISLSVVSIDKTLHAIYTQNALGGLVVAVIAAGISLIFSRRISHPLEILKQGAERFARGELLTRLEIPDSEEIGSLAEAMNQMAAQLDDRIRTMTEQRNQHEAILSSMTEGVLAVDSSRWIIRLNHAAAQCLEVQRFEAEGKRIDDVINNESLRQFVSEAVSNKNPLERDIVLRFEGGTDRYLQAHGTPLCDADGKQIGSVVVLNDVTRLHRLENIRRDFVANVSHELKTPITSIKGFVETLLDGALRNTDDANRFLRIVSKQADRLHAIIEDLLSLSRIEQEKEKHTIQIERHKLLQVIQSALDFCHQKASEKNIALAVCCDGNSVAAIDPPLLEQALVNLVDNAIKYSEPGKRVEVTAAEKNGEVTIDVRDWGCGISNDHHPRIFERFYRVDKARSRKLGGTGLGLAIVRHIIEAHNGYITVESKIGSGSTFTIHLPKP